MREYRPESSKELDDFMSQFCDICQWDKNGDCPIIFAVLASPVVPSIKYPAQWTYNDNGESLCTAFAAEKHVAAA